MAKETDTQGTTNYLPWLEEELLCAMPTLCPSNCDECGVLDASEQTYTAPAFLPTLSFNPLPTVRRVLGQFLCNSTSARLFHKQIICMLGLRRVKTMDMASPMKQASIIPRRDLIVQLKRQLIASIRSQRLLASFHYETAWCGWNREARFQDTRKDHPEWMG